MPKTPAQKKISLAGVRQTLDDHEARYLYECDLADRHNRTANDAGAAGDEERAARFRDYAHKAGERALKLKELVEADREQLHDIVSAPARRKARDATTTGGADPAVHHRAAARLKQRADRSVTKEAKDRAQAGMPPHDPRTAAGKREYHIAGLGRSKRASTLPHQALFYRKATATPIRISACDHYEALVLAAQSGLYPEMAFEPRVDSSSRAGQPPGNGYANERLRALQDAIGLEGAALLYLRIIENRSARSLAAEGFGDEKTVQARFTAAVDGAARFFNLTPTPFLIDKVLQSVAA
jgi:hypothetical protein